MNYIMHNLPIAERSSRWALPHHSRLPNDVEYDVVYSEEGENSISESNGYTELIHAVLQNFPAEQIDSLIHDGEDVNYQNFRDDGKTPLHYAVSHRSCNHDVIRTLLRRGADINARSYRDHRTPLHFAVQNPYMTPDIVRLLLSRQGANVNVFSDPNYKFTPLHYAVGGKCCKHEIVQVLLDLRADLRHLGQGLLPIHVALMNTNCSMEVIKLLILTGSPVSPVCKAGSPLFILLCRHDCDREVLELMLRNKADPNSDVSLTRDIHFARSLRFLRVNSIMHGKIENFNRHIFYGLSYKHAKPLIAGLIHSYISTDDFELLLRHGGDPNLIVLDTRSVLTVALESAWLQVPKLRVLLKYGAKFCEDAYFPCQALFSLLSSKQVDFVIQVLQAILDNRNNFDNLVNRRGCNLLHHALEINAPIAYLMVIMKYFPPDQKSDCQKTALHHAVLSFCPLHIMETLLENSNCVDARDDKRNTPLHLAGKRPELVNMLLRYGANTTLVNIDSLTPVRVYFESHEWSFEMAKTPLKAMVLNEYLDKGYFDSKEFVNDLFDGIAPTAEQENLNKNVISFVQDCQSDLGYACIMDPSFFYLLVSRFLLKLHLKKGIMKPGCQNREKRLLSIKEKMFQTLQDKNLLWMLTSGELPIYKDFLLFLMNKHELSAIASILRIPTKAKGLGEYEYAAPLSLFIVAEYLTSNDLNNLILAFINTCSITDNFII